MNNKLIIIGNDHAGYPLKVILKEYLTSKGFDVKDVGCYSEESVDYPLFGKKIGEEVIKNDCRGIAICGTGQGISIACNKVKGIRAANCYNTKIVELSRSHNDINVLGLGARVISIEDAKTFVDLFLTIPFDGGRHERRVNELNQM